MATERMCPRCGRANPAEMPRCMNCGQRVAGGVLLQTEPEQTTEAWWRASAPVSGKTGVPVPPQVREEVARAESVRREAERRTEEERVAGELRAAEQRKRQAEEEAWLRAQTQRHTETLRAVADSTGRVSHTASVRRTADKPKTKNAVTLENCPKCDAPVGEAGATFSFCVQCGADLAPALKANRVSAAAPTATTGGASSTSNAQTVAVSLSSAKPQETNGKMNPLVPAALSFFWPGIGQFANRQGSKGALLLLAAFVATSIFHWQAMGFLMIIMRVLAGVDAYRIAERRRTGAAVRDGEWDLG